MNKKTMVKATPRTFAMGAVVTNALIESWKGEKADSYHGIVEINRMCREVVEMCKSGKKSSGKKPKLVDTTIVQETAKKLVNGDIDFYCVPEQFMAPIVGGGLNIQNHEDLEDLVNSVLMEIGAVFCNPQEVRDD